MGIEKTDNGWKVDIRPGGREGKRFRKTFPTKAEALRFEAWTKTQYTVNPEWEPVKRDKRRLSALVTRWYDLHGKSLKDGSNRKQKLLNLSEAIGNPQAHTISAQTFANYRARRLESGTSANTVNHEHAYLRAMFNELERIGEWHGGNPLEKMRQIKIDERELSFLDDGQIKQLLAALDQSRNKDAKNITLVCLATGARWSEAETLRAEQVRDNKITYWNTKSGKPRAVPISEKLQKLIKTKETGRLFGPAYQAFQNAVERAGLILPERQMTHILRHTFASQFMQRGGNILALQRILGHASLTMTMRYAHLAPEHLEEATRLNPVADIL